MYLPKLLGTYEMELSAYFRPANLRRYGVFISLGCAEGYYTNGIAHVLKQEEAANGGTVIIGVDRDEKALAESQWISELNGLRVQLSQSLDWEQTARKPGKALVICDVEGSELELLAPGWFPALRGADLIVEVHDDNGQTTIMDELQKRFASTHESGVVFAQARKTDDFPNLITLEVTEPIKAEAMNERRVKGLRWLVLKTRTEGGFFRR